MPRLRLNYAVGSSIISLPDGASQEALGERIGSHLADLVTSCHNVAVHEIPSAALGAPLQDFLADGTLGAAATSSPLLLAASYRAAVRLDIKGLVRAVERALMKGISKGNVRLAEVATAFAGCPRIAALCDWMCYLDLKDDSGSD